jgi:hypothetical protein
VGRVRRPPTTITPQQPPTAAFKLPGKKKNPTAVANVMKIRADLVTLFFPIFMIIMFIILKGYEFMDHIGVLNKK